MSLPSISELGLGDQKVVSERLKQLSPHHKWELPACLLALAYSVNEGQRFNARDARNIWKRLSIPCIERLDESLAFLTAQNPPKLVIRKIMDQISHEEVMLYALSPAERERLRGTFGPAADPKRQFIQLVSTALKNAVTIHHRLDYAQKHGDDELNFFPGAERWDKRIVREIAPLLTTFGESAASITGFQRQDLPTECEALRSTFAKMAELFQSAVNVFYPARDVEDYVRYRGVHNHLIPKLDEILKHIHAVEDAVEVAESTSTPIAAMSAAAKEDLMPALDPRHVFVVHGRNHRAREAMFTFLRTLGLRPLEWSQIVRETGEGSPYVGEVLATGLEMAQAVVVLLTPDDVAMLHESYRGAQEPQEETTLTGQPRQNVLFEAGMAMALDRRRTVLVELGRLRTMTDVVGRHVIRMNDSVERRKELAERLKTAGCSVDDSGSDWLNPSTGGQFTAALPATPSF